MATKLEQQIDKALAVLAAHTRPVRYIVRKPRRAAGKGRAKRGGSGQWAWRGRIHAKPGTLLLGGVKQVDSSPFRFLHDAEAWAAAMMDQPNADRATYAQVPVSRSRKEVIGGKKRAGGDTYWPGRRVQMHPGTDAWMMGDRYGTVERKLRSGVLLVKMDASGRTRRVHERNIIETGDRAGGKPRKRRTRKAR